MDAARRNVRVIFNASVLMALAVFFVLILSYSKQEILQATPGDVSSTFQGYVWSDTIGWISLNCNTGGPTANNICATSPYKVTINANKTLTGYGWSDNVGWIKFGGLSSFPVATTTGNAFIDSSNNVVGWARAVVGDDPGPPIVTDATETFSTPATGATFTVPEGVTSITAKAWGAGGGSSGAGGMGGGGGFGQSIITVTPGEIMTIDVGSGGTVSGGSGSDSVFRRGSTHLVRGGGGGGTVTASNGAGGIGYVNGAGTTIDGNGATPGNTGDASYISGVGVGAVAGWDISTAVFSGNVKSVKSQSTNPSGLFFKPDGTKMYIVDADFSGGPAVGQIDEFNLSPAWSISSATYLQSTSTVAQAAYSRGMFFKPDGTEMYVIAHLPTAEVNQYHLSTAWNISTASFVRVLPIAEDGNPAGITMNTDGTMMYVSGQVGDKIIQYSLSTAWNISTATWLRNLSVGADTLDPHGIFFRPDGKRMFVVGQVDNEVNQYNLSTAWDISTASFSGFGLIVTAQDAQPAGLYFKDGTKMFLVGNTDDEVDEYTLNGGTGSAGGPGLVQLSYTSSVPSLANGWDGWISLNCSNTLSCGTSNYGLKVGIGVFASPYAWGSNVLGWLSFNQVSYTPFFPPTIACKSDDTGVIATDQWGTQTETLCQAGYYCSHTALTCVNYTPSTGSLTIIPTSLRVRSGATVSLSWTTNNADTCSVIGTNGDVFSGTTGSGQTSSPLTSPTTFTLSCIPTSGGPLAPVDKKTVKLIPIIKEI